MNSNKIKIEPDVQKLTNVLKFATEPGPSGRLASLKIPRDLKLGGSRQKVFRPNLVERTKKNDVSTPASPQIQRGRGRGRGRGEDRGRGAARGRNAQNFIQSHGIFSEGIAEGMKRNSPYFSRSQQDRESDVSKMMDKPTFTKNSEYKVDKAHEDKVMKQLLDDHIDQEVEIENEIHPITLPMHTYKIKQENGIKKENGMKLENSYDGNLNHTNNNDQFLFDIQEKLILFQFPDCLPGIGPVIETETTDKSNSGTDATSKKENVEVRGKCTLRDINEGKIGKILMYKSGKTKLVIGNSVFDIDEGLKPGFLQDVISVNTNITANAGDMINLGSIENTAVVTPQFDDLLNK